MGDVTATPEGAPPEQQPQQVTAMTEGTQAPMPSAPQQEPSSGTMFDHILRFVGGSPKKYAIDPSTGQETGTPETDRGTLAKHIVAAALVGLFKGAAVKPGPGSLGRAAGAGGEAGVDMAQQQDAQARQDAQGDYQRQQDIATQKANALEKNLRLRSMAQSLADQDEKTHQTIVGNYAEQLQRTKDESPESILAEGIPEHEAKDPTKYSLMDQRVPDGVVPRLGPDGQQEKDADGVPQWEQTYTVVDQHSKSTISGAQWVKDANEWGIPGSKSLIGAPAGAQLTNVAQNHYIHQVGQLQTMQAEMDGFAKKLGIPPIDLKSKVKADPSLIEAVNQFQRTSGASTQPDAQIAMMQKDPKAAPFAQRVMGLFGADNLNKFTEQQALQQQADQIRNKGLAEAQTPEGQEKSKLNQSTLAKNASEITKNQAETEKALKGLDGLTPSDKIQALRVWQPTLDSAERVQVMRKNLKDGLKGDQQAMLSLLSNHLGMTMGLQKGARLNQAIISEAQKSQPWLQGVKAKFSSDGYLSGVVLSPDQMRQMVGLGEERYKLDIQKSRTEANYIGVDKEPSLSTKPGIYASAQGKPRLVSYDEGKTWEPAP